MSDSRRSGRSRKAIDYASFGGNDSDEDFADPTPPAKKPKKEKVKTEKKIEKRSKEKNKKDLSSNNNKRKERPPLDDKLFDRDLELALQLSKQESQNSGTQSENEDVQYMGKKQKEVAAVVHSIEVTQDVAGIPLPNPLRPEAETPATNNGNKENVSDQNTNISSTTKKSPPKVTIDEEDPITVIETIDGSDGETVGRRRRKAASAAVAKQQQMIGDEPEDADDGDEEFKADDPQNDFGDSGSDDDYDAGDADSDFEGSKTKKKKKGKSPKNVAAKKSPKSRGGKKEVSTSKAKPRGKSNSAASSGPARTPLTSPVTPIARRPQHKGPVKGFTPPTVSKGITEDKKSQHTLSSSQSSIRKPSWCSPTSSNANNPLGGVKLVSPSHPIRLGLSRHARVKSLHSNVKYP